MRGNPNQGSSSSSMFNRSSGNPNDDGSTVNSQMGQDGGAANAAAGGPFGAGAHFANRSPNTTSEEIGQMLDQINKQSSSKHRRDNKSKSAPVSVNRSESYKERSQKRSRNNRRKTSDPSISKNK